MRKKDKIIIFSVMSGLLLIFAGIFQFFGNECNSNIETKYNAFIHGTLGDIFVAMHKFDDLDTKRTLLTVGSSLYGGLESEDRYEIDHLEEIILNSTEDFSQEKKDIAEWQLQQINQSSQIFMDLLNEEESCEEWGIFSLFFLILAGIGEIMVIIVEVTK